MTIFEWGMSLNVWFTLLGRGLVSFQWKLHYKFITLYFSRYFNSKVPGGGGGYYNHTWHVTRGRRTFVEGTNRLEPDGILGVWFSALELR